MTLTEMLALVETHGWEWCLRTVRPGEAHLPGRYYAALFPPNWPGRRGNGEIRVTANSLGEALSRAIEEAGLA